MAKAKKIAVLTPEERLAQALVPESERPYSVPENWCWVKVGCISCLHRGVTYKKENAHPEKTENDCLIMRGGNIQEGSIDVFADNIYIDKNLVMDEQLIRLHDIIIVSSTGSTKVIGRAGISYDNYSDVAFGAFLTLVRPIKNICRPFVSYYFQSDLYRERVRQLASGVNINNIRSEYITDSQCPLPPLAEQQRIVDRIESLFAKLDEAKEKAQAALDSFETRKAAILHKAFTGELTAKWRKENGVGMDSWKIDILKNISKISSGGTPSRTNEDYYTGNIPWIKTGEIFWNEISDSEEKISKSALENSSAKIFPINTVVVAMYGMGVTRGRAGTLKIKAATNQAVCALIPHGYINYKFLYYYFMNNYEKFRAQSVGGNQLNLSGKLIAKFKISIPSIQEQTEIVRILDDFFAKEQKAKELCSVLDNIDLIKKSILARAFRGELGTNDPAEESAVELVKSIL